MNEPFLAQSLLRGDGKILGWVVGGAPFESMEFTMIVFRTEAYRNNPEAVKAFLRSHLQAVAWINQNPEAARSLLARELDMSKEVGRRVRMPRWPTDARNAPEVLNRNQMILVDIGFLKAPVPLDERGKRVAFWGKRGALDLGD